jgi:hypothetical protein
MSLKKQGSFIFQQVILKMIVVLGFCLINVSSFSQNILEKSVSFSYRHQSIKSILKDIEEKYAVYFSFSGLDLSANKKIEFSGTLAAGLKELLSSENIGIELIGNHIILRYIPLKGRKISGQIVDRDSKMPLAGATIFVIGSDPFIGSSSDDNGFFKIKELPIGRYDFQVQYLGYEPLHIHQVLNSTGKEIFLNIELRESTVSMPAVIVEVGLDHSSPLNDMAATSGRSFSVEETKRFAAAISDPARMVQSFAGISSGGDDLSNEIIIRGNSTRGLSWRLEGVEIPNPNHFGGLGNGGGAISMLSASTLTNSDFYTGAFPAEYGNALSGVFDLQLRKGNADRREHSFSFGNLGFSASTEGYFKKGKKASYLANFRYSTLDLIKKYLPSLEGLLPAYRDVSFKINIPTEKAGQFSVFGLGGKNYSERNAVRDSTKWETFNDATDFLDDEKVGVVGVTNRYLLSDNAFIKTSIAGTYYSFNDLANLLIKEDNYRDSTIDDSDFRNADVSGYFSFHQKINAENKLRTGFSFSHKFFKYEYLTLVSFFEEEVLFLKNKGQTQYFQSFFQWQRRIKVNWEMNAGINFSYLFLNNTKAVDPRASIKWELNPKHKLAFALGIHSKPEHLSTYFIERIGANGVPKSPNKNLSLLRALHLVFGYDWYFSEDIKLKVESYYQYLYHIPVSDNPNNGFSVLNIQDVFDIIYENDQTESVLVSEGTGENYGIDLTFEHPFKQGYYFLLTASLFDSKYLTQNKRKYHTVTAVNHILNILAGKEWKVGRRQKNIFGLNGKFTYYGGRRDTPIDLAASRASGFQVEIPGQYYSKKISPFIRVDASASFTINSFKKMTHSLNLDVQNILNRRNEYNRYYDVFSETIQKELLNGLIPFGSYRVEF